MHYSLFYRAISRTLLIVCCFKLIIAAGEILSGSSPQSLNDKILTGSITDNDVPIADQQSGKTPEFGHCYHFKKMDFHALDWIEKDLFEAKFNPETLEVYFRKVSKSDWIEIDACARTMMAEMGGERSCTDDYDLALARIIANRASYTRLKATKKSFDLTDYLTPTKTAVSEKYQFAVWSDDAKVREGAPCPLPPGKFTPTMKAKFEKYVNLCKLAVVDDGRGIKMRTMAMNDHIFYYTSGCRMHYARLCQGYQPIPVQMTETVISDYRCFEMWKDPNYWLIEKENAQCMEVAKACCLPNSDRLRPLASDSACKSNSLSLAKSFADNAAKREAEKKRSSKATSY